MAALCVGDVHPSRRLLAATSADAALPCALPGPRYYCTSSRWCAWQCGPPRCPAGDTNAHVLVRAAPADRVSLRPLRIPAGSLTRRPSNLLWDHLGINLGIEQYLGQAPAVGQSERHVQLRSQARGWPPDAQARDGARNPAGELQRVRGRVARRARNALPPSRMRFRVGRVALSQHERSCGGTRGAEAWAHARARFATCTCRIERPALVEGAGRSSATRLCEDCTHDCTFLSGRRIGNEGEIRNSCTVNVMVAQCGS